MSPIGAKTSSVRCSRPTLVDVTTHNDVLYDRVCVSDVNVRHYRRMNRGMAGVFGHMLRGLCLRGGALSLLELNGYKLVLSVDD